MARGLASLAVFFCHARALFFVEYGSVFQPNLFVKFLYFITGFGHQAVMLFFVLSGYLISSNILHQRKKREWKWSLYLANRFTRLYIVLIPALLLTTFWDYYGIFAFGTSNIYGGLGSSVLPDGIMSQIGAQVFIGNALFLQNIFVPSFGSNAPLWSLNYELWYYILLPLLLTVLWKDTLLWRKCLCLVLAAIIIILIPIVMLKYFSIWLMGLVIAVAPAVTNKKVSQLRNLSLVMLALFLIFTRYAGYSQYVFTLDASIGTSFACFLYTLLNCNETRIGPAYRWIAKKLSDMSYTIYLVHIPILVFINAVVLRGSDRWQPDLLHFTFVLLIVFLVTGYSFLVWNLTEAHQYSIRKAVCSKLMSANIHIYVDLE
jgi:peptidoglycan/LPS O-acetylase OafA/YrhL